MAQKKKEYAVGIDLGTTYSCVAIWREDHQRVEVIPNEQGNRITPSWVAFEADNGQRLIGEAATNQANRNPTNSVCDSKRLIGRKYSDHAIKKDLAMWPFKVIAGENGNPMVSVTHKGEEKYFSAEQISAMVLGKMREYAETYLGSPVKNAVITVPAYFNDSQRQATKDAGAIAGLNVLRIINEPSAAAIAYGIDKRANCVGERNIFIFDLGGGTFDVSLVNVKDGIYEVMSKDGNNHLGGEDFVNNMMSHFMEEFKRKNRVDISSNAKALRKLRTECEKAKKILSINAETTIEIDSLFQGIDFSSKISRAKFEELNMGFFRECMEIVERCLYQAKIDKRSVHDVVLVGGSSRIPKLQDMLRNFFKGRELDKSINPDEAVAYGAAIQAAMLCGGVSKLPVVVLLDVTPLSLGILLKGDIMSAVIPRNTRFPVRKTREYCTSADNQTSMVVKVYEGERKRATDNNFLGSFSLPGFPRAPRGHSFTTCFEVDADGILHVSMEEKKAGKIKIVIDKGRLSNKEITRLIEDSKMYEEEDKKFLEKANAINALDKYVYDMDAALKNKRKSEKLSKNDKSNITSGIAKGRKVLNGKKEKQTIKEINDCMKQLKSIFEPIKGKIG